MTKKELIIATIEATIATLDTSNIKWSIEDHVRDLFAENYAMGLFQTLDVTESMKLRVQNTLNAMALPKEAAFATSDKDEVQYFVDAIIFTYENYYERIKAKNNGEDLSLEEHVTQMVRHEWRHCMQFGKLREAGLGYTIKFAASAETAFGYGQGPLEYDAWSFQKGNVQEWDTFIEHYKSNWEKYVKVLNDQGYTLEDLEKQEEELKKQVSSK